MGVTLPYEGARLEVGDIAPGFILASESGGRVDMKADDVAGNFVILLFCADPADAQATAELRGLAALHDALTGFGTRIFAITRQTPAENAAMRQRRGLPFPLLSDADGKCFLDHGMAPATGATTAVIIGPNQHVLATMREGGGHAEAAAALIGSRAAERQPVDVAAHPPVLVVPEVLSPADCQRLIGVYTLTGHVWVNPGHREEVSKSDYKMRIPEYGRRDRVDHWIMTPETNDFIDRRLKRRLVPEIRKAFQYRVTQREAYRIGCYEGERGGEMHGHRDNSSPVGAHRRFAVSINLNAEAFEGGALRFPEFGDQRYRPATGAAIAFSCSLLHEALHVTAGRRFVLLAFLHGKE